VAIKPEETAGIQSGIFCCAQGCPQSAIKSPAAV
jgi:hypothetical protein